MANKVAEATRRLAELEAKHLDAASVTELLQLAYRCHCTLAPIGVKTLGRVATVFNARPELLGREADVKEGSPGTTTFDEGNGT